MKDLENEIRKLSQETKENRHRFLQLEIQTTFIAVEKGRLELSLGNWHEAQKELVMARKGAEVIEKFLKEGEEPLPEVEAKLDELKKAIETLRVQIESFPN